MPSLVPTARSPYPAVIAASLGKTFVHAVDAFDDDVSALDAIQRIDPTTSAVMRNRDDLRDPRRVQRLVQHGSFPAVRESLDMGVPGVFRPFLEAITPDSNPQGVADSLASLSFSISEIGAFVAPRNDWSLGDYVRRHLYWREGLVEVIVITWPPGAKSSIHDHGGSAGADMVLLGPGLLEESFGLLAGHLSRLDNRPIRSNEAASIPREAIHRISNPHDAPVVSLHVYFAPMNGGNIRTFTFVD